MQTKTILASTIAFFGMVQHVDAHGRLLVPPHRGYMVAATPGATVDIQIQITANHKGFFEFGLCKLNGKADKETEECFQSLAQPNGEKQWQLPAGAQTFSMQYKLPSGVTCDGDSHCVLRWWYVGGNNPGQPVNGQEQFWNCADIYISNNCGGSGPSPNPSSAKPSPSSASPSQSTTTKSPKPHPSRSTHSPSKKPRPSPSSNPAPKPKQGDCGSCSNCYYAPTQSCFVGWSAEQCAQVSTYTWCGSGGFTPKPSSVSPTPSSNKPSNSPSSKPTNSPSSAPTPGKSGLTNILPKDLFQKIFPKALPIYKYENFVAMAGKYPSFANTGDADVDRREVAAFLGQISLESGDLQYVEEINKSDYCQASGEYPCEAGKQYYG
ncbi:hypothetical protein As57867_017783, partial [Aphanomyces stellatus]